MVKKHNVIVNIQNKSDYTLVFESAWYDSGRLADGFNYPSPIGPGDHGMWESYEKDNALAGCSGFVDYTINGGIVTIAFSNPSVGTNKLGVGLGGKNIWDDMSSHDYDQFTQSFEVNGVKFNAICQCTGGDVNNATIILVNQ